MRRMMLLFQLGVTVLAVGCTPDAAVAPGDAALTGVSTDGRGGPHLTVMTRNMYIGADVDRVIGALATPDPTDDLPALLGAIAVVQATDFPARAAAMVGEIARFRPHVVGLQEVSRLDVDLNQLGIPSPVIHQDFLVTLQALLVARGLEYTVAATVQNTTAQPLPGVSLVDYDVLLVDTRRVTVNGVVAAQNFQNNIGPVAPGVTIVRGYVAASVKVDGTDYVVLDTHLESGRAPGLDLLRAAQATEIAAVLGAAGPAILLGDFNDDPGSPMWQVLAGAGFTDVWGALRPNGAGFTCCHAEDLSNPVEAFTQRIDYIWARGTGAGPRPAVGTIRRIGLESREKVPGPLFPLWPSDHAGVVSTLITVRR
jgi:endonuclease/exonuclease/phosphatase family metal-dependent hydrolase